MTFHATEGRLTKYFFLSWSHSGFHPQHHRVTGMTPGTHKKEHDAALHAFSFKSAHPKGELVIVNYIRKVSPMWQIVHATLWASSWLASHSERVLQSRGRKAMHTHAEHWDGRVWERVKSSEPIANTTWAHIWGNIRIHFLHALANTTEHRVRARSQRTEQHKL